MPRKVDLNTNHYKMWNMYVNEIDKTKYLLALTQNGKQKCQAAAVRAFMYLYSEDKYIQDKINSVIDKFIVYNKDNKISQL